MNIRGHLYVARRPLVMGIINCTSDSFYAGSRALDSSDIRTKIAELIDGGADIIDVGACSTRPGADEIDEKEELSRLSVALGLIREVDKDILVSVDTYRSGVASFCLGNGADIINDISGGKYDDEMFASVASHNAPYILMHSSGDPCDTADVIEYPDGITASVVSDMANQVVKAKRAGIKDLIVDPGFGFSKTITQNYRLLRDLPLIDEAFGLPVLVGVSRKSMLYKPLHINQDEALSATISVNTVALMMGASIVRVHDPLPARHTIELISLTYDSYLTE